MITLAQAKHEFENGFYPDVNPEKDKFLGLINDLGERRFDFAKWVYGDCNMCYIYTRRVAGLIVANEDLEDFMDISARLVQSEDPDDRDSAFSALSAIDDPRRFDYLRILLQDGYLQFSVIDYMYNFFPDEVLHQLHILKNDTNPEISAVATAKLQELARGR